MSWLTNLFKGIENFFASPRAKAAEAQIAALVPLALPIVRNIAALTQNRTVQQITAAYQEYAVPLSAKIESDPDTALRDLATAILRRLHAPETAISILNTAVELAVQAAK